MTFVSNKDYRSPRPIEVPFGEPFVLPPTTVNVVYDARGREVGYDLAHGVVGAQQAPHGRAA